jgi:3-oxoacyl-[acyl-carrier protein] reductase
MSQPDSSSGPVVLITGAGKGIGRACAAEAAARGWSAVLVSRTAADLEASARPFPADRVRILPVDIAEASSAARAVELAERTFSRLDAVIHCAGVAPLLPLDQTTPEIFRQVLDTNLTAAFLLARSAWRLLARATIPTPGGAAVSLRGGVFVTISSMASRDPFPGFAAYAAAKAGVNLLTLALHREGAPVGIRCYAVAPGAVETDMFRKLMTPEQFPTEKTLSPESVAKTVWACVDGALANSSGETIFLAKP